MQVLISDSIVLFTTESKILGGRRNYDVIEDSILRFDIKNNTWSQIGRMKRRRKEHGISVVLAKDIMDFCH